MNNNSPTPPQPHQYNPGDFLPRALHLLESQTAEPKPEKKSPSKNLAKYPEPKINRIQIIIGPCLISAFLYIIINLTNRLNPLDQAILSAILFSISTSASILMDKAIFKNGKILKSKSQLKYSTRYFEATIPLETIQDIKIKRNNMTIYGLILKKTHSGAIISQEIKVRKSKNFVLEEEFSRIKSMINLK